MQTYCSQKIEFRSHFLVQKSEEENQILNIGTLPKSRRIKFRLTLLFKSILISASDLENSKTRKMEESRAQKQNIGWNFEVDFKGDVAEDPIEPIPLHPDR